MQSYARKKKAPVGCKNLVVLEDTGKEGARSSPYDISYRGKLF